jgi:hypothetical protein
MKKQFNNFVEVERTIQFLQWQEITSKRQKNKGTREFKLPINSPYGNAIHVASYSSGYVRRTRVRSCWQLNKTYKEKEYIPLTDAETGRPVIRTFNSIKRKLILDEQERLAYLIGFCLKNYYIGQANMLSNGEYIPKWKYDNLADAARLDYERQDPEVKVMVNGHRYNVSEWFK